METFVLFIKNLLVELKKFIFDRINLSKVQAENPSCQFYLGAKIHNVSFGNHVVVYENVYLENCNIGSYSYVQKNSKIFNTDIGNFCSIATGVSIGPGIHRIDLITTHPSFYIKDTPLPIVFATKNHFETFKKTIIGNDVWIGEGAIILDGVSVGNGAVIAAGAIVVKEVEPYSVVGGVPARHLKYRFDEETIALIEKSEWWNYSDEWFENNAEMMLDVNRFKEYLKEL